MCGRYYVDDETAREIERVIQLVNQKIEMNNRDVCPTGLAPVLYGTPNGLELAEMQWGFPGTGDRGLLINARRESVLDRISFRDSVKERRCVIPAAGFYEWDKEKSRVRFERTEGKLILLAGIWKCYGAVNRFVILTGEANASVEAVHERMPLILEPGEVESWILDPLFLNIILNKALPKLKAVRDYEQLSLENL